MDGFRNNPQYSQRVNQHRQAFIGAYRNAFVQRAAIYNNYYNQYAYAYQNYWNLGFYGGYYYGLATAYNIADSFYNPLLYWFYADQVDEDLCRQWYGSDYDNYPFDPFPYANVYYPTTELEDLVIGVSALPDAQQSAFRDAMVQLTDALAQDLADATGEQVTLDANDVVVSHYEALADQAVTIEGYVSHDNTSFAFKALIDLNDPSQTLVFVPTSTDGQPTDYDLGILNEMNARIVALGGNPNDNSTDDSAVTTDPSVDSAAAPSVAPIF